MKYHKEIMNEITKKYNESNDELNNEMQKAVNVHTNIFSQKIVSTIAAFIISYCIHLVASPFLAMTGIYNIALVRPLTLLASLITTAIIAKKYPKNSERFTEYMNSELHVKRIEEEIETEIAVANVKSKQAILLNMASKVANEQDILSRIEKEYTISNKIQPGVNETINNITELEKEKEEYENRLNIAIKQNVLMNHFISLLKNKKPHYKTIKYCFIGLSLGVLVWNVPQSITSLFVASPSVDILTALLSSILPPLAFGLMCGTIGNKIEKEENYVFNKLNNELGENSISEDLSLNLDGIEKEFDELINRLVDINLQIEDNKQMINKKNESNNNYTEKTTIIMDYEKPMTLKYTKKN